MRRLLLASLLLVTACTTDAPPPTPAPQPVVTPVLRPVRSDLLGLTAGELVQRFGAPALQVREGTGLKLQFRARTCVLDAYLYATAAGGLERVTHVDARLPSGADTDRFGCVSALTAP